MYSINHPLPSRLVCPAVRIKHLKSQCYKVDNLKVDNPYYFSNAKDDESSHSHHLLPLLGCNNSETVPRMVFPNGGEEAYCGACGNNPIGTTNYFCKECDKWYHKECVESPSILKSSYHPKHSLQLHIYLANGVTRLKCESCVTRSGFLFYHCSVCNFYLDPVCATKPSVINNQKTHEHTLYYFPRKPNLICDVCGGHHRSFLFICLHCDFVVHKRCIYLPHVIKISRHKHRLSFASSLSSQNMSPFRFLWSCGVCRREMDENYGAYSCMTKGCIYAVHTYCATRGDVWDGKELEEEPEEVNESKPSFEEISDGIILHFSHLEHPMRLDKDVKIWNNDEIKYCQACIVPLFDGKAYTCTKCDYVLHEACAYLPRVKQHPFHTHSLTLEQSCTQTSRPCELCCRDSFGFKYMCYNTDCNNLNFDVRCASISEQHKHQSHRHPLFLSDDHFSRRCSTCHGLFKLYLNCEGCHYPAEPFVLCFRCATLPYTVRYKNDEHLLTFSYEKSPDGVYWCDLCEGTIGPRTGFYGCNECEVILHVKCLLGEDLYMNPGSRVTVNGEEFNIVQNNALSRPICRGCRRRCEYRLMFIASSGDIYCSIRDINAYH